MAGMIQFGYLSLLQNKEVTIYQQPMLQWSFVFGYNDKDQFSEDQTTNKQRLLTSAYNLYGYKTDFGSSNNIMIMAAAGGYALAAVLMLMSMLAKRATARKLSSASFAVANDLCYAILVFSTPNIITSICIQIK